MKTLKHSPTLQTYRDVETHLVWEAGGTYRFHATVGEVELDSETWEGLTRAIDNIFTAQAKADKFSLDVMNDGGETGSITGIHMGTSSVTGTGSAAARYTGHHHLYPVNAYVRALLKRIADYRRKEEDTNELLDRVEVNKSWGYGKVKAEDYPQKIERLKEQHQEAITEAERLEAGAGDEELMELARKRDEKA